MVFGTALSGIQASTKELDVIGHNIANASTTGFKSSRAEFADVYSSGALGSGALSIGSGVRLSNVQQSFGQGHMSFTNNALDLGVSGNGFFVLSDNGSRIYSRAGAFTVSHDGFIENAAHLKLQGLAADAAGNIGSSLGDIKISKENILPRATTSVTTGLNLDANSKVVTANWDGGPTPGVTTYNNLSTTTVFDSLGNSHVLSTYFIKADSTAALGTPNASSPPGTNNQWYVAFQLDGQNVPANVATDNTDNLVRVNFNADGSFNNAMDVTNTLLPANLIPISKTMTNGAENLNISVDLTSISQFGTHFAVQSTTQDGYTTGQLSGLEVSAEGVILGSYTNGRTKAMGQVQLANFANNNGLIPQGDTTWSESANSGQAIVGNAGDGGLGYFESGSLEDSNVDLTAELVKLISAQRNFQANAQTIKTADSITQTIINIR